MGRKIVSVMVVVVIVVVGVVVVVVWVLGNCVFWSSLRNPLLHCTISENKKRRLKNNDNVPRRERKDGFLYKFL